jgi:DNA mismatch repair protein MutL
VAESPIRLLPNELVDQIAAGEVVERPASVVKELVENALDAGAGRIRVEVRHGGAALISVTDDGHGMPPDEARMALQRHATSKLQTAEDLLRIASFGFRGEALPAIASVSRLRLLTRARGRAEGHEIRTEGGRIIQDRAAGGPEGTRIEVADLFFNVPARRKFLKKPGTEWGHVADWLGRLALALPGVHFDVLREDREALVWPATDDPLARIAAVLSEDVAQSLLPIVWEEGAGHVEAYVSGPDRTRANASALHLFVNGRPVRDKLLRHAVMDAYRDILPKGRYPSAVVFLTVPPESVDVNVHPAKWEVRFGEAQAVHQLVRHAIREAMKQRRWLRSSPASTPGGPASTDVGWPDPSASSQRTDWIFAEGSATATGDRDVERLAPATYADQAAAPLAGMDPAASFDPTAGELTPQFGAQRLIGQMRASYLLLEGADGLILVDQHAAHERVLYERLRASWLEHGVERQGMLLPVTVELDALATAALGEATETTKRLGFELEPFGESAVVVRAMPALLAGSDPAELVRGLAEQISEGGVAPESGPDETRLLEAADRVFASLACHSARRFGDHLETREQQAILDGLDTIPWAPSCPHGRPVATTLSVAEIERRFGRR